MTTNICCIMKITLIKLLCVSAFLVLLVDSHNTHAEEYWNYQVQTGDTLWNLSKTHLSALRHWKEIQKLNNIKDPNQLDPGSTIRFPVRLLRSNISAGRLIKLTGEIKVQRGISQKTQKAYKEMLLWPNDTLSTGPESNATIQFGDNSKVLVQENSVVLMQDLKSYGKSNYTETNIQLKSGRIQNKINPKKAHGSRFEISTPSAVAAVRGTEYRVSTEDDGESKTEVLKGEVGLTSSNTSLHLPGGFGTISYTDKAPANPIELLAPPVLGELETPIIKLPFLVHIKAVDGAASYRMQISDDLEFDSLLFDSTFPNVKIWGPDLPNNTYYSRVRGIDKDGLEGLDTVTAFTIKAHPVPPMLSKPASEAVINNAVPTFEWSEPKDGRSYHFQLSPQPDFKKLLVDKPAYDKTSYTPEKSILPGVYFWRVATVNEKKQRGPYNRQEFRLTPPGPDLSDLKLDSEERVFRWPENSAASKYRYQIAHDPEFNTIVVNEVISSPQFSMKEFGPDAYFIRVAAIDPEGYEGPFSAYQKVEIPSPPPPLWSYSIPFLMILAAML